jgi:hypothetical protein
MTFRTFKCPKCNIDLNTKVKVTIAKAVFTGKEKLPIKVKCYCGYEQTQSQAEWEKLCGDRP